jgi:hypothetical protein
MLGGTIRDLVRNILSKEEREHLPLRVWQRMAMEGIAPPLQPQVPVRLWK